MDVLLPLLAFVITILLLVSIHEAGHFMVAKALGVKVIRYAIGFGRPLYSHKAKSGTEYTIGLIPLGGYVKLLDEREVIVPESEKHAAFNQQPLWARTLIVLAGPVTNIILAILCFWLMFMIGIEVIRPVVGEVTPSSIAATAGLKAGDTIIAVDHRNTPSLQKVLLRVIERLGEKTTMVITTKNAAQQVVNHHLPLQTWTVNKFSPDPLAGLGIMPPRPFLPAVIEKVESGSPAETAGILPKDKILAINNAAINNWYDFITYIQQHPGQQVTILIDRAGQQAKVTATIGHSYRLGLNKTGRLGVQTKVVMIPEALKTLRHYPPGQALTTATRETIEYFAFNFLTIKKMILGQISLGTLGGPISIFQSADLAFKQGLSVFLGFLGLISIMLAFINILPIPGLDGGHLFNYLIEFIIRRPIPLQYELMSIRIGFFLLLLMMVVATVNDILRLLLT